MRRFNYGLLQEAYESMESGKSLLVTVAPVDMFELKNAIKVINPDSYSLKPYKGGTEMIIKMTKYGN